jgi:predicted membrane protein
MKMERIDDQPTQQDSTNHENDFNESMKNKPEQKQRASRRKKTFFGLAVLGFGVWWLLRRMDIELVPDWVMTWPSLLIGIGVFNLVAHQFRSLAGYIMVTIGGVFLARNAFDIPINIEPYFWPAVVIFIGLIILIKPHKDYGSRWKKKGAWKTRTV